MSALFTQCSGYTVQTGTRNLTRLGNSNTYLLLCKKKVPGKKKFLGKKPGNKNFRKNVTGNKVLYFGFLGLSFPIKSQEIRSQEKSAEENKSEEKKNLEKKS